MGELLDISSFQSFTTPTDELVGEGIADSARSSSELAVYFQVNKKTVQTWYQAIVNAYSWMLETDLKFGAGKYVKYTPFCIQQMTAIRTATTAGKTFDQWVSEIHAANPEFSPNRTQTKQNSTSAIIPANPSSLQVGIDSDLYAFIDQELSRQKLAEADTLSTLEAVEAEIIDLTQQFETSQDNSREAMRREILQQAVMDAVADERDYQQTYLATRNRLRAKKGV